ncbi:DUF1289 domain-containing protein [Phytopseudomonas seleniipraecipitans]|uniref:DUF1289 domain-containing protein n=1 Tax=Phytopseudomonas seleniipraecipitans TaxID=640205 RepID=UPI0030B8E614
MHRCDGSPGYLLCVSCGRTGEEIRKWRGMKRPEKMATVQKAARMKAIAKKKSKGWRAEWI